jgi:hypothetical protein
MGMHPRIRLAVAVGILLLMRSSVASARYDCVVIGAGVRLPPRGLAIFEVVINAVHKAAPGAAIAFNTRPDDSADAAARWLPVGSQR